MTKIFSEVARKIKEKKTKKSEYEMCQELQKFIPKEERKPRV